LRKVGTTMGLVILGAVGFYLLVSFGVVLFAASGARKHGKSAKRWGWSAALVMYLIPFWDWLPTVAVHQYYCATESGFWVYKTLDQWKAKNPGVMETLVDDGKGAFTRVGDDINYIDKNVLNQRFHWTSEKRHMPFFLPIYSWKFEVVDSKNGDVLARRVDFSSGEGRDHLKFWMNNKTCDSSNRESIKSSEFTNQFKGSEN
jgi:hypothetical protein